MDPTTLLIIVVALACPIGMGTMMWLMMRQGGHQQMGMGSMPGMANEQHASNSAQDKLAALQAEKDALEEQIRALETVQRLQSQRDRLEREIVAPQGQTHV